MTVRLPGFVCTFYPRFSTSARSVGLNTTHIVMRGLATPPRIKTRHEHVRERLIHELSRNPNILDPNPSVSINRGGASWLRRLVLVASSTVICMGIYLSYHVFQYHLSDETTLEAKHIFYPLWLGVNWPRQRQFPFPGHLKYFDQKRYNDIQADHEFQATLGTKHIEHQVLNCLFRSPIVREIFKLPISVWTTPADTLDLWIEPRYSTLHGPLFTLLKKDGIVSVEAKWHIKSIAWMSDIESFISDLTSELESLSTAEASRNTHSRGSGRIHEANTDASDPRLSEYLSTKDQSYIIALRGTLQVSDLAKQRKGVVSFTGLIDNTHPGLNAGVRIMNLTLEVDEPEKPSTVYKLK